MGFGWLLLGYLTTFVLYLTANRLRLGSLALLLGCSLMFVGVLKLEKYEKRFGLAKFFLIPLLACGVYQLVKEILSLCKPTVPFFNSDLSELAGTIYGWIQFFLLVFLQAVLLLSVSEIAKGVGLLHLRAKAIRNMIFLAICGILTILTKMTFAWIAPAISYLNYPRLFSKIILIALNLFLFLSCMKNIAPANEDDLAPKRYRWEFLNKIGDTFEKNRREAAESGRAYAEEKLRQRQEAREKKRIQHSKKK